MLSVARVLAQKDHRIVFLDEFSSGIDMKTDALLQKTVRDAFADRTVIIIAHRLKTIADCDRVMVLNEGKILEFASPETLRKEGGYFASLMDEQERLEEMSGDSGEKTMDSTHQISETV